MKSKKVILVSNTSWYLYNFKLKLIKNLIEEGYQVILVAPFDKYTKLFSKEICFKNWNISRKSLNPFKEIISIYQLIRIYKSIKPDYSHHFTIKACIYGSIASKLNSVKYRINAHTGLISNLTTLKRIHLLPHKWVVNTMIRFLILDENSVNIFQNNDDLDLFNKLKGKKINKALIIPGSGVDTEFFKLSKPRLISQIKKNILFPSRLIKEKGLKELICACNLLWEEGYSFQLNLAGFIDNQNNSSFTKNEIKKYKNNNNISFLGHIGNMKGIYEESDIVVLPSWREGLSKSLIEAASMECSIVTTNVPGCKDVIDHGINGIIVPVRNVLSLKLAIQFLLLNPELSLKFGRNAREKVIKQFNVSKINQMTLGVYSGFSKEYSKTFN